MPLLQPGSKPRHEKGFKRPFSPPRPPRRNTPPPRGMPCFFPAERLELATLYPPTLHVLKRRSPDMSKASDARTRQIEKVISHIGKKAKKEDAALLESFITHYYSAVAVEDLLERSPADLYAAAVAHFEFARKRTPGKPRIRIYNPSTRGEAYKSTHTIVEMVNDDMPFLVDSTSMALAKHGYAVHLTIHPIFKVIRDKRGELEQIVAPHEDLVGAQQESFIRVEIDRETSMSDIAALEAELAAYMDDVRAAVEDWAAMRGKASEIVNLLSKQQPPLPAEEVTEGIKFIDWLVNNHFTFLGYREY